LDSRRGAFGASNRSAPWPDDLTGGPARRNRRRPALRALQRSTRCRERGFRLSAKRPGPCSELTNKAERYLNMRLVSACRTLGFEQDPSLRRLVAKRERVERTPIGPADSATSGRRLQPQLLPPRYSVRIVHIAGSMLSTDPLRLLAAVPRWLPLRGAEYMLSAQEQSLRLRDNASHHPQRRPQPGPNPSQLHRRRTHSSRRRHALPSPQLRHNLRSCRHEGPGPHPQPARRDSPRSRHR